MNSRIVLIIVITTVVLVMLLMVFRLTPRGWQAKLVSPDVQKTVGQIIDQSSVPSPTPKQIKFNTSTNLNEELDKVNPQVLDSDFSELE